GIIPGCGPQIIFVTLYTKGMLPFAALLANAISQDGDALFPLIAIDKKSALWSTGFNTIAALIVGLLAYLIEVKLF
ncbi:putative manganese transporter, partial [Schnuerera sp.]|uniref:putative manganese transporter n=1 Tax=Schnuerera sp. TaxID=2794844 RepID=UPI002CDB32C6